MDYENLYNSLEYNVSNEDLSVDEKKTLTEVIMNFDVEKKTTVYFLILHDYLKTIPNPGSKIIYPYKCKQITNTCLEIKLDALPVKLKRILYKFAKLAETSESETELKSPYLT